MIRWLRQGIARRVEALCPVLLLGLAAIGFFGPAPRVIQEGAAWPSFAHPLGVDRFGQTGDLVDLYRDYRLDAGAVVDAMAKLFMH